MDWGFLDFARLHRLCQAGAFFVTRLKSNTRFYVAQSRRLRADEEESGLRSDQTIRLNSYVGRRDYPDKLRRISYVDPQSGSFLVFLANQFDLESLVVTQIYRRRWSIEVFFK
jgi:hypothetical protein